jgi:hypothetical protein
MEFRLTYEGKLASIQGDPVCQQKIKPSQRENKYAMRRAFHAQLRRLWEVTPFLNAGERSGPSVFLTESGPDSPAYDRATLAARHARGQFNWIPLVTKDLNLICGLDVLFLRPDPPGSLVWRGDVDNRIKTLIDALKIPDDNEDYHLRTPLADEQPMYCLLQDDRLVTKLSVETDQLLDAISEKEDRVKLIITVRLRPHEMHLGNIQFG